MRSGGKLEHDYRSASSTLGRADSSVHKVVNRNTGECFACKSYNLRNSTPEERNQCRNEARRLCMMDHPCVVKAVDVYERKGRLDIVMECLEGGDLLDLLNSRGALPELEAARLLRQMTQAVSYVHSCGFVHLDLKLENFVLEKGGMAVKLVDLETLQDGEEGSLCGTPGYMAPELLDGSFGPSSDMWSLGICASALLTGSLRSEALTAHSKDAQSFVQGLLSPDPEERLSAQDALSHPFLQMDLAKDGKDLADLSEALVSSSQATPLQRMCSALMAASLGPNDRSSIRRAFDELDSTCAGSLSPADVGKVLSSKASPEDVFVSLTSQSRLSFQEFTAAMCSTFIPMREGHAKDVWRRLQAQVAGKPKSVPAEALQEACASFGRSLPRAQALAMLAEVGATSLTYQALLDFLRPEPSSVSSWTTRCLASVQLSCFAGFCS